LRISLWSFVFGGTVSKPDALAYAQPRENPRPSLSGVFVLWSNVVYQHISDTGMTGVGAMELLQ
jgi:hypothetical protein